MPNRLQTFINHLMDGSPGVGVDPMISPTISPDDIPTLKGYEMSVHEDHVLTAIGLHNRKRTAKTKIPFGIGYELWADLGNALRRIAVPWRADLQKHEVKAAVIESAMRPDVAGIRLFTDAATGDAIWFVPFLDNGPPITLRYTRVDLDQLVQLWLEAREQPENPPDDALVH